MQVLDDAGRTALSGQLRAIAAPADPSPGIAVAIAKNGTFVFLNQ